MTHKNTAFIQAISFLVLMIISCSIFYLHIPQVLAVEKVDLEIIQFDSQQGINSLVKYIIKWAFRLAGVFAFIMIVYAGFQYLTSGGNTAQQKDAQERIVSAIIGIVLLFSFYIILYTINPDILKEQNGLPSSDSNNSTTPNLPDSEAPNYNVSKNLVNIIDMGIPVATNMLGSTEAYLDETLAEKLLELKNEEPPWVVTDACIDPNCQSTSEPNRNPDDCHLDGTCVDVDVTSGDLNELRIIFNDCGLNVLDEGDHLHIALPEAEGYGSYQGNPYVEINGQKYYWYPAT